MDHPFITPQITLLYGGLLGIVWFVLTWGVIAIRRTERISLGDGDNALLRRRMRGQANFIETVPLVLVLMMMLETSGLATWAIHILGLSLTIGRVLHGYAFWDHRTILLPRMAGMLLTFASAALAFGAALAVGLGLL